MKNRNAQFYIKLAIWAAIQIIIWNLPASGSLTKAGVHTIAAFAGLVFGMCFLPKDYGIYTMGCLILMGFSGAYGTDVTAAFKAGAGAQPFTMMLAILLFSAIIVSSGLMEYLAVRLVSLKITAGRPWVLVFIILMTSCILSLFVNAMVILVIMTDLVVALFKKTGMKGCTFTCVLMASLNVITCMAMNVMPFQLVTSFTFSMLLAYNPALTFQSVMIPHMLFNIILELLIVVFYFVFLRIVAKKDIEPLKNYVPESSDKKMTYDMKVAVWIFIGYILIQILALALPSGSAAYTFVNAFGMQGYCALACIAAMFIRRKNGEPWMSFEQLQSKGIIWPLLMIILALSACSDVMSSDVTGISSWLLELIKPLTAGVGAWGAFAIIVGACILLTNFTDNMAVSFMAVPIIYAIAVEQGLNPCGLLSIIIPSFEIAVLLPSSQLNTAFVFEKEYTGFVKRKTLILTAIPCMVFVWIVNVTLGYAFQGWFTRLLP